MKMRIGIATLCQIVLAASSFGSVQEFENEQRPDFFDAVGGASNVTTIGFSEVSNNTTLTDQYRSFGVTFEGLNFITSCEISCPDGWGLRIINGNHLYFEEPINWIAADIIGTMRIELYSDDELFYTSTLLGIGGQGQFGGLVSEQAFNHVRIFDDADPITALDDLHFGPPINVPAPGALLLVGSAALGKRRRR